MDVNVPLYYCNRDPLVIGHKSKVITEWMDDWNSRLLCTCSVSLPVSNVMIRL